MVSACLSGSRIALRRIHLPDSVLIRAKARCNHQTHIFIGKPHGFTLLEMQLMTPTNEQPRCPIWSAKRLTLLCSAAVLGSALVIGGPLGYGRQAVAATPAPVSA